MAPPRWTARVAAKRYCQRIIITATMTASMTATITAM
jgi:hypothetical protein